MSPVEGREVEICSWGNVWGVFWCLSIDVYMCDLEDEGRYRLSDSLQIFGWIAPSGTLPKSLSVMSPFYSNI